MAVVGYARVSTRDQDLAHQLDALRAAGCAEILEERGSGAKRDRPVLAALIGRLQAGDVLVAWHLDRLGRSTIQIAEVLETLQQREVVFRALAQGLDSSTPTGRGMLRVIGALAEMEADLIRERVRSGLAAARQRGRVGGRPRALSAEQVEIARRMLEEGTSMRRTALSFRVDPRTLRRTLARSG